MPVVIVPNQEIITAGSGAFKMQPLPTTPLYQDMPRMGINPILYETINPAMAITVQGVGGCPVDKIPELITSVTLVPGQGATGFTGKGNNIVKLVDIADKAVPDIPAFNFPGWSEPRMQYGSISGPPSPTMTLVAPLRGYYGEKYFYDAEYIYASYYANSPEFQGVFEESIAEGAVPEVNRLTAINLLEGRKFLEFSAVPEGTTSITTDLFPGPAIPITLQQLAPLDEGDVLTIGSDYLQGFVPEISSWVKWRPSFIELMMYHYTLIVTHTCPPFVTTFSGTMLVNNNWTPAANRLSYYIQLQKGFLDTVDGSFGAPLIDEATP